MTGKGTFFPSFCSVSKKDKIPFVSVDRTKEKTLLIVAIAEFRKSRYTLTQL